MKKLVLLFTLCMIPLFAVKIHIVNDSAYVLHGNVYDINNEDLGTFEINPGTSYDWFDSRHNAKDYVKGPFTVTFICPGGDTYGTISRITENRTVRARSARGPKTCRKEHQPPPPRDSDAHSPHYKYRYYQRNN